MNFKNLIAMSLVLAMVGSSSSSDAYASEPAKCPEALMAYEKEPKLDIRTPKNEEVIVNDIVKGYSMTAEESVFGSVPAFKPQAGNQYIKITVTIKNISSASVTLSSSEFKIHTSLKGLGRSISIASPTYYLKDKFPTWAIMPGGTLTGSMIFEVPKGDEFTQLVYTPVVGDSQYFGV